MGREWDGMRWGQGMCIGIGWGDGGGIVSGLCALDWGGVGG